MNTPAAIVLASASLAVAGTTTYLALAPERSGSGTDGAGPGGVHAAAPDELAALRANVEELRAELRRIAERTELADAGGSTRLPHDAIDAAVARYLDGRSLLAAEARESDAGALEELPRASVEDLVAELLAADELEATAIWKRLAEEGRADEVLALLEERAENAPTDPDVQLELGQAYIARIQEVGNSPLAGEYATKADAAFDRALTADPEHWDARFYKAVSLSFWPPVFGKQNAAIEQFEILVQQQGGVAPQSSHAQTHLLLGNMYQQIGDKDKALAAWRAGLDLFPDNESLQEQLALVGSGN